MKAFLNKMTQIFMSIPILIVEWVFYLTVVGPWLISARDWILVSLGVISFLALVFQTYKKVDHE